jgi:hypothetical protein
MSSPLLSLFDIPANDTLSGWKYANSNDLLLKALAGLQTILT